MPRAAGTAIVLPPLRAPRPFIDCRYFADLGAVQAAAVVRAAAGEVAHLAARGGAACTCATSSS